MQTAWFSFLFFLCRDMVSVKISCLVFVTLYVLQSHAQLAHKPPPFGFRLTPPPPPIWKHIFTPPPRKGPIWKSGDCKCTSSSCIVSPDMTYKIKVYGTCSEWAQCASDHRHGRNTNTIFTMDASCWLLCIKGSGQLVYLYNSINVYWPKHCIPVPSLTWNCMARQCWAIRPDLVSALYSSQLLSVLKKHMLRIFVRIASVRRF